MPRRLPQPSDDVTVYLVLNDHGRNGLAYDETDPAEADRETTIRSFLSDQYSNALRVIAFNTAEGWSRDVSEEIAAELLQRAFDADDNLGEDTKRFHRPAHEIRREAATCSVIATRRRGGPSASKDRLIKKAPVFAGAFGARMRRRGGMGCRAFRAR
jgi:hypothetical protein